jgi:amino acid adenylation domain-containing protein
MHPCLHHLFEGQVQSFPDAIAIRYQDRSLTYDQLNRRANQVAHCLRQLGASSGTLVGLGTERSELAIIGLMGILKAGAAYVPLDPHYPAEWRSFILKDSDPDILITQTTLDIGPANHTIRVDLDDPVLARQSDRNLDLGIEPDDLMYVLYTSGSTGHPKGVMVTHANVARLFPAMSRYLRFDRNDIWTLFHSHAFGFSIWEMWGALAHGGCLVIVPPAMTMAPANLLELIASERVTVLSQTPSAFRLLARAVTILPELAGLSTLRLVAFSGEALEPRMLESWLTRFGDEKPLLVNMYALTETAGEIAFRRMVTADLGGENRSSIGVPLPDVQFHLLDSNHNPVDTGQIGELYVGGPAVALGYLNQPELTAARFIPDFSTGADESRLYRTGDLARRRPDGDIEFIGRVDRQIKVRGYRVEPGDIEATLMKHPQIDDAVVVPYEDVDGLTHLAAYLIPNQPTDHPGSLHRYLGTALPHYAIPDRFVFVNHFPLTPNGKLDVAALSAIGQPATDIEGEVTKSTDFPDSIAQVLMSAWQELLNIDSIGLDDDFFELGGYSLLAFKLVTRLEERLMIDVTMRDVFENPVFASLLEILKQRRIIGAAEDCNRFSGIPPKSAEQGNHARFMRLAIQQAKEAIQRGHPPYAACIVKDDTVIACVHNAIQQHVDPTAHAEVEAIRHACRALGTIDLSSCIIYSTCEPCSMCLTACAWANIATVVYSARMNDEADFGLSQPTVPCATMQQLLDRPIILIPDFLREEMLEIFETWFKIKTIGL